MELQVRKKDGRLEPFQKEKIVSGVMKSGVTQEQADVVASKVDAWARETAENGVIDSTTIRVKVVEELKMVNPQAGTVFESYSKAAAPSPLVDAEPVKPAMPVEPVMPAAPVMPPEPVEPEDAARPVQPPQTPVQPVEPTQPAQPLQM